jgi:hypothetical protein
VSLAKLRVLAGARGTWLTFRGEDITDFRSFGEGNENEVYIHLKKGSIVTHIEPGKQYTIDKENRQFIAKKYVDHEVFTQFVNLVKKYLDAVSSNNKNKPIIADDGQAAVSRPEEHEFKMLDALLVELDE